jgi:aryl-alcohol dehydrogenase-like predicted oxidoreductase
MDRREFSKTLAAVTTGVAAARAGRPGAPGPLPTRRLGRTDLEVPILALGGYHVGQAGSERAALRLIDVALEEGIRFFDTAESYQSGTSERWIGAALKGRRDAVTLMTKTFAFPERTAESARRHLEGSLGRLQTDHLDLWQLHSVRSVEDVDRAFGPGGAMEYILDAKAQGIVRYVGVTGHAQPRANRRALEYWDRGIRFDAMQLPINPIDYHQQSFQRDVLPGLVERGIGVIAMKTSADGALLRHEVCSIDECLRYVWSLPVSVAVVGMERPELVRRNAQLARELPMKDEERDALRARLEPQARLELEWYKGD